TRCFANSTRPSAALCAHSSRRTPSPSSSWSRFLPSSTKCVGRAKRPIWGPTIFDRSSLKGETHALAPVAHSRLHHRPIGKSTIIDPSGKAEESFPLIEGGGGPDDAPEALRAAGVDLHGAALRSLEVLHSSAVASQARGKEPVSTRLEKHYLEERSRAPSHADHENQQ